MARSLLITNIGHLLMAEGGPGNRAAGRQLSQLPLQENAWLLAEEGRIKATGSMSACPSRATAVVDAEGGMVLPTWCDSHTHLVFAESREHEFVDRIKGLSYEEIARRGGGILNSAGKLQAASEASLFKTAWERLEEIIGYGTGAVEIKSGYGLTVAAELKMLRVVRALSEQSPIPIRATFLGAHALPLAYRGNREAYIRLVIDEMLPLIAGEGLADYIDVFCEKGFYSVDETVRIIEAGAEYGLKAKVHTNQFNSLGCIEACVDRGAVSVDHLEVVTDAELEYLKNGSTIPTLLPSAPFFIGGHYQPARRMIDAGLPVALASDYNPGSTPSGKMQFVLSLACLKCGMLPSEAIQAATINGASAMELGEDLGSLVPGKRASFILTPPVPGPDYLPYAFGSDLVQRVYIDGQLKVDKRWAMA